MPDKRSRQPTLEPEGNPQYLDLTVEQARALRAEQARLAALCADRYTGAQGRGTLWRDVALGRRVQALRCEMPPARRAASGRGARFTGHGRRARSEHRPTHAPTHPGCRPDRGGGLRPCVPPARTPG